MRNHITDVPGIAVGHAHDEHICSGVTVILPQDPVVAAIDIRGGGPGTRESDAIGPDGSVSHVHAIVLSGGSAFGLAAATGVQAWLSERGVGFPVGDARVPIVPQTILFDLLNGGNKAWGTDNPYPAMAIDACNAASASATGIGSIGAGYGATTANLRGGLGSASQQLPDGLIVGALVAVNAVGRVTMGDTRHFWANALERDSEFGGLGPPPDWTPDMANLPIKGAPGENTTLAVIATNAALDRPQARRLAVMAQTGMARAIHPVHTPLDGDAVFSLATGKIPLPETPTALAELGSAAADTLARAVARAIYEAADIPPGWVGPQSYRQAFGHKPASRGART